MDAAGTRVPIRHVLSDIDPQGCKVCSFKQPSAEDLEHDSPGAPPGVYLSAAALVSSTALSMKRYFSSVCTRILYAMKECHKRPSLIIPNGTISRVPLWTSQSTSTDTASTSSRYSSTSTKKSRASGFSRALTIQKKLEVEPRGHSREGVLERLPNAYEQCVGATRTHHAPWFVVPADDKNDTRLIFSQIVLDAMMDLFQQHLFLPQRSAHMSFGFLPFGHAS